MIICVLWPAGTKRGALLYSVSSCLFSLDFSWTSRMGARIFFLTCVVPEVSNSRLSAIPDSHSSCLPEIPLSESESDLLPELPLHECIPENCRHDASLYKAA